jgi:hypothetical protein
MVLNRQAVLNALRAELAFLKSGGYRNPSRAAWRPQFIFEDSPTCLNRILTRPRKPCSECALAGFILQGFATRRSPCRYIPLNESGDTIDSFYRTGAREELESAVEEWLKATIRRVEREEAEYPGTQQRPDVHVLARVASAE